MLYLNYIFTKAGITLVDLPVFSTILDTVPSNCNDIVASKSQIFFLLLWSLNLFNIAEFAYPFPAF